ncbi:MAG: hypothetical protein IJO87_05000 [Eggerthellaceae bacterium]|nr:hypothetical protein [Eggerthellaceae bacterium]
MFDKTQFQHEADFGFGFDEYDPLEDLGEDDGGESNLEDLLDENGVEPEYAPDIASNLSAAPATTVAASKENQPPEKRIAQLMENMGLRSSTLRKIIAYCETPRSAANVNAKADELQANVYSVFTAANLCALLENAGAIKRITEDGTPYEEVVIEPRTVVDENGIEYLEATDAPDVYWISTEPGMEAVEADRPGERTRALLLEDAGYLSVYRRILELCSTDGGASVMALNAAIEQESLVPDRKYTVSHFVELLEDAGAVEWRKPWFTTEAGLEVLSEMAAEVAQA